MNEEENKKILAEIESNKKELDTLKANLIVLNSQKESWFEKKRQASKKIFDLSRSLRDAKGKRNTFTKQVRESKLRRQELNKELKNKLQELKEIQQEKRNIADKFGIRIDPSKIQQEIDDFEFKIETEALPFRIEQQMMKKIAEKKKILEQAKKVSNVFEQVHTLRKDVDRIRKKADETHRKVQSKAESSQQCHEELVESSQQMKDLRTEEDAALKKFIEEKAKWSVQNDLVKAKIDEIRALKAKIDGVDLKAKKHAKKADAHKIVEQKKSVDEKIKKGMKLTTEDLLAFQANEMDEFKQSRKPAGKIKKKEYKKK